MLDSWKFGLLKHIPKVVSLVSFGKWGVISLMGGFSEISTNVVAKSTSASMVHPMQYEFIVERDIPS